MCFNLLPFIEVNEQYTQALITDKPTIKIVKSGDGYTWCTTKSDKTTQEEYFVPGVEYDEVLGSNNVSTLTKHDSLTVCNVGPGLGDLSFDLDQ